MVFTAAQTASFFEDADQMAIPHATVVQLVTEGITTVDDLADFDEENLKLKQLLKDYTLTLDDMRSLLGKALEEKDEIYK